jgi:uncharacterized protein YxeA
MKLIVALLLIISYSYTYASEYMVMQYNDNVRIVLSKEKCDTAGFKAVAQRIDRQVMQACWSANGDKIHIQWEGGDFSEFPVDRFSPVEIK